MSCPSSSSPPAAPARPGFNRDPAALPTADLREQELKRNLRDGVTWEEHERRIADLKGAFAPAADADAAGPGKAGPAR